MLIKNGCVASVMETTESMDLTFYIAGLCVCVCVFIFLFLLQFW